MTKKIEYTESCGNVFEDLGLENADYLLAKSRLRLTILDRIEERGLTKKEAAKILGTQPSKISGLSTGEGVDAMSFDQLLDWLQKLDLNVTVSIQPLYKSQKKAEMRVTV